MSVLRAGILEGARITAAGGGPQGLGEALTRLGAVIEPTDVAPARADVARALVFDATGVFGAGGRPGLLATLDASWEAIRDLAVELIGSGSAGKLLLIAPGPGAGPLASSARAAMENMVRTLSIEWARYAITACVILPGVATTPEELCEVICFLLSPGGDYFSGCRFELGSLSA